MNFISDLRYAVRSLTKSPVFTCIAVLSLALGIGANAAVFTLLNQMLLRLLPVQNPEQIVQLKEVGGFYGSNTGMNSLSYPVYRDLAQQNQVFSGMFARHTIPMGMSFAGRSELVAGELVSGTYFPVLGLKAERGRLFSAADDRTRAGAPFAVISYDFWKSRFGAEPNIVGKHVLLNNHDLTIVGVAPQGFRGVEPLFATQVFVPAMMAEQMTQEHKPLDERGRRWVQVFARLKLGISVEQAKSSLAPIFHQMIEAEVHEARFAHAAPETRAEFLRLKLDVFPGGRGQNTARQFLEAPLWAMMAMVGLVLLIACGNVANLIIARATSRQKETAVRLAIGASRSRIMSQLLAESLLLAFAGGACGILLSMWTVHLLSSIMPHMEPPIALSSQPDGRILLFTFVISLLTAVIFGFAPALQSTRPNLAPTLKDQASAVAGGGQARWRKLLVCLQVSLSLLLLIGAGLFVGTLKNLKNLNPGFEVNNLISFAMDPTLTGYQNPRAKLFYKQLQQNLEATPGVRAAALCVVPPLTFDEWDDSVTVEGYHAKPNEDVDPWVNYISPGFFNTMKIAILQGRDVTDRDVIGSPKVVVINERFARRYFGNQSPIGRHIGMGGDPGTKTDIEIVGVVRDTKYQSMRDAAPYQVFFPYQQSDWATQMTAYVRTDLDSTQVFPVVRSVVHKMDANLPVYSMKTESAQLDDALSIERLVASLSTAFGVVATVLAAIGLYGVLAFLVAQRTREIGIRMAMGALRRDVLKIIMREVLILVGGGILIGLPVALVCARLIGSQLYGLSASDPRTVVLSTLLILGIAAASGYIPARRATLVDPMTALRYE